MALLWTLVVLLAGSSFSHSTFVTPTLPLSFSFNWDDPLAPFPVPVTEQCETLNIKWSRGNELGPNPVAPYYLQIYTSSVSISTKDQQCSFIDTCSNRNFIQPFVVSAGSGLSFNYTVPFAPGTIYQICMFDKFGNTGGCQDQYTVIQSSVNDITCSNVTFVNQLNVNALVDNGPLSQYGFIDQCTDISLIPTNGVPPYTLTVAPSLHPPYNITSFDTPINWTVSLNRAMPFFISLADSNGSMWSNGLLHASSGGTIGCLAGNVTSSHTVKAPLAIGISILTLFIGVLLGVVGLILVAKQRSNAFVKLPDPKPESQWGKVAAAHLSLHPAAVSPFQLSQPSSEVVARNRAFYGNLKEIPGPLVGLVPDVERPPSYPNYPASRPVDRDLGHARNLSSSTTTTVLDISRLSSASIERHYDPRGPLRLTRSESFSPLKRQFMQPSANEVER